MNLQLYKKNNRINLNLLHENIQLFDKINNEKKYLKKRRVEKDSIHFLNILGKRSFQLGESKEHYFGAMQEQQTFYIE